MRPWYVIAKFAVKLLAVVMSKIAFTFALCYVFRALLMLIPNTAVNCAFMYTICPKFGYTDTQTPIA